MASISPQHTKETVSNTPIGLLISPRCPVADLWVEATIQEQTGEDTYLIYDETGSITLFLPSEELLQLRLCPQMRLLIYGTVDISPIDSHRNELYAQKIFLAQS